MAALARRPLGGACAWGGGGLLASALLPNALVHIDLIHSAAIVGSTLAVGSLCVLLPLGAARGCMAAAHELVVDSGEAAAAGRSLHALMLAAVPEDASDPAARQTWLRELLREQAGGDGSRLGGLALGGGVRGTAGRMLMSPFLPSTATMLERVQGQLAEGDDAEILAAASEGIVAGFVQDKKDTLTMIGGVVFGLVAVVGLALDNSAGTAAGKLAEYRQREAPEVDDEREEEGDGWRDRLSRRVWSGKGRGEGK